MRPENRWFHPNQGCVLNRIRGDVRLKRPVGLRLQHRGPLDYLKLDRKLQSIPYSLTRRSRSALNKKTVMRIVFFRSFSLKARFQLVIQ
jgi:hypothetical protein